MINDNPNKEILDEAKKLFPTQLKWRRHLHQFPETSYNEFKTTAYLKSICRQMKLKNVKIDMPTGLLVEIINGSGKTAAVRTDIDALPVTELTTLPFKSKNKGCMHACGHDMHMASVLGCAYLLSKLKKYYSGTVRFIFQPAEECPPGGASPMIKNGALKNVGMIFGLHVDPTLDIGKIGIRDGATMASVYDFDLTVIGKGGHAAYPHASVDAVTTAAAVIEATQMIVSRQIDPINPVVITFGKISGGTARNVICDRVTLNGTARTLSKSDSKNVPKLIKKTAENTAKAYGASVEINHIADYPPLSNTPETNRIISKSFEELYGKNKVEETDVTMGGEDFACYLEKVKGAMFRLGVRNLKIKADKPWHSPYFTVDENALSIGAATLAASVINYLNGKR